MLIFKILRETTLVKMPVYFFTKDVLINFESPGKIVN